MTADDNIAIADAPDTTREHRRRAACVLSMTGQDIDRWIETGVEAFDGRALCELLGDLAEAFAEFEHELLLCPTTVVHGMEESTEICANCGTSSEDYHTIRDCFAKYKTAMDAAHNQVTHYLNSRIASLERDLRAYESGLVPLHVYWDNDSIWVVARDAEDAARVYAEYIGDASGDESELEFVRWPDEDELSIRVWVSGPDTGKIAPIDEEDGTDAIETQRKPAHEWVAQQGRGFLCYY